MPGSARSSSGGAAARRRSPRQQRARVTVDAILEAAREEFARRGPAGTTTDRIAARAGVSVGSLYQYFGDKEAVLAELARRHLAEGAVLLGAPLEDLARGTPEPEHAVGVLVDAMIALHARDPALHRVLSSARTLPDDVGAAQEALADHARTRVADWLARLAPGRASRAPLAARLLVEAVDALTHRLVLHPAANEAPGAVRDEIVRLVSAYVARYARA